jgi:hypothetical protein
LSLPIHQKIRTVALCALIRIKPLKARDAASGRFSAASRFSSKPETSIRSADSPSPHHVLQLQALPAHRAEFLRGMARKNCGLEVVNSFTYFY